MSGVGKQGPFWEGTAAARAALTAADGLQANHLFYENDTGDMYRCTNTTGPVWAPFQLGSVPDWTDTIANLVGFGTDDGVAVGQTAWDTTRKRQIACATAAASTSTWTHHVEQILSRNCTFSDATERWWNWHDPAAQNSAVNGASVLPQAAAGEIRHAWLKCIVDPADDITIKAYVDGSEVDSVLVVAPGTGWVEVIFDTFTWTEGSFIGVSANPETVNIAQGYISLRAEYAIPAED